MGALANAERPRKEAPRPAKAYADPEAEQPAYAYPGYHQPTAKRLAKRAAHKLVDDIHKKFAEAQIDTNPEPDKAYAHPGYEQPAYKRLAKRDAVFPPAAYISAIDPPPEVQGVSKDAPGSTTAKRLAKRAAPVEKTNDYDYDEAAYADPNAQRYGPPLPAIERLAKRAVQPKVAKTNDYDYFDGDDAAYPEYRN